jgi:hypothetical protein
LGQAAGTRTRDEILAPLPPDQDRDYSLYAGDSWEAAAPDGTRILSVVHRSGLHSFQLLRLWLRRGDRYSFLKALVAEEDADFSVSADWFRFRSQLYVRLVETNTEGRYRGSENNQIFRVERNSLIPIRGAAATFLNPDETTVYGGFDRFQDESLTFESWIAKNSDPACCARYIVEGTYTIVGNELRVATWKRQPAD